MPTPKAKATPKASPPEVTPPDTDHSEMEINERSSDLDPQAIQGSPSTPTDPIETTTPQVPQDPSDAVDAVDAPQLADANDAIAIEPRPDPRPIDGLNPAQNRLIALLGNRSGAAPEYPATFAHQFRADLEHHLQPIADAIPAESDNLWVNKHDLSTVHGCEVRFLAEKAEEFAWTVPMARGTVAHKAIELRLGWRGEPSPMELVDEALARLEANDRGIGEFLQRATEADLAELRTESNERVASFMEMFPPLKREWRPVVEARMRSELCGDRIVLNGKVDLTLGQANGTTARKVLIDFKTGGPALQHRDDLRFYALLDTLRVGVPPRMLATVYLESGRIDAEEVSEGTLDATIRRVADGVARLASLARVPDDAAFRPGKACRWCPLYDSCEPGQQFIAEADAN